MPEQRAAIGDRSRDLFVSAGAGTGKSSVLVARFCDAVCAAEGDDRSVGVENVLAFTFTERAAGELKRRIRSELAARAAEARDPARARALRSLARDSESAWVSTIHSFCRRLLGANPLAAGLDPGFRVLGEAAATRVAAVAFDAAFGRFCAQGGGDRFELAAAYRTPVLRDVVRGAHDELRSRGLEAPELPPLEPPDVAAATARLHAAATAALAATDGATATGKFEECRALIADAAAGTRAAAPPEEDDVVAWGFESSARGLDVAEVAEYHAARALLQRVLVESRFAGHYEHLRELIRLYADEYGRRKLERSALDFEDLQLCARRVLTRQPDVRRRYQRQFQHLMVDEFQDTNALQLAIVRLLHEEEGAPVNRLFTVGDELQSIYAFRHADLEVFRSERARAEAAPDAAAAVGRLGVNFRSRPEALSLVNAVGRHLFGSGYEELRAGSGPDPEEPQAAVELLVTEKRGWDDEAAALEVSPDEQAQSWRVAEARELAARLLELTERGVPRAEMVVLLRSFSYVEAYEQALGEAGLAPYVVGGRGYWSKQQVSDVRNLLACVANPLDDKALLGALSSPACGVRPDTLWLLRQAAGPAPLWAALERLYGAETAPADAEQVPSDDAAALCEFGAALADVRAAAPRLSLEALIERIITATGYDLALLMRRRGRRRMGNVRKLMRLAREFEASEGRDLRAFLDFAAGEADRGGNEAEAAVDAEGHDGVRVMTVHAAKGLEFPLVAVADLGRSLAASVPAALQLEPVEGLDGVDGRDGRGAGAFRVGLRLARLGRKQTGIYEYEELKDRAAEREREEEQRILHVAMTRAQRHLLLSGVYELERLDAGPRPSDPLIAAVLRGLGWTSGDDAVEVPRAAGADTAATGEVRVPVRVQLPGERPAAPAARNASLAGLPRENPTGDAADGSNGEPEALADPDLGPLAPPAALPLRAISYSALALFERCAYRFYAERVVGLRPRLPSASRAPACGAGGSAGEAPQEEAAPRSDEWHPPEDLEALAGRYARGRVVHRLLERSARDGWSAPEPKSIADLLANECAAAGPEQVTAAGRLVEAFLSAPIRRELEGAVLQVEAPFAFRAGGLVVRGEIDLVADLGPELLVVDYKSDALGGATPHDHMERYMVQCRIYALAALRRYGKPVRVAYVFLERPGDPVEFRFAPDQADAITTELAELADALRSGPFEVTDSPERSLCFDCPARERLCVHGPELTMRDSAG